MLGTMTRDDAKHIAKNAEFVKAYGDGKKLQYRDIGDSGWTDSRNPTFESPTLTYRIKPEPKYRPFTAAEAVGLIGKTIRTCLGNPWKITEVVVDEKGASLRSGFTSFGRVETLLLTTCTFEDGYPCGVKEEG